MSLRSVLLSCLAIVAMAGPSLAAPIKGQVQFNSGASTPTYSPLNGPTGAADIPSLGDYTGSIAFTADVTSTGSFGGGNDFAGKTLNSGVQQTTFSFFGSSITVSFGTLGTFTGDLDLPQSGGFGGTAGNRFIGTFTPGSEMAGFSPSAANLLITLSRSSLGVTPQLSGTMDVLGTSAVVPEPTTYALAAFGAMAMGVVARRRRA